MEFLPSEVEVIRAGLTVSSLHTSKAYIAFLYKYQAPDILPEVLKFNVGHNLLSMEPSAAAVPPAPVRVSSLRM